MTDPPRGTPVPDADTPCPACGAADWEQVERDVVCVRCGHAIGMWTWYAPIDDSEPTPEQLEFTAAYERERAERERWIFEEAFKQGLPILGLVEPLRPPTYGGSGWSSNEITSFTTAYESVRVTVDRDRHGPPLRLELQSLLSGDEGDPPRVSEAALTVWLDAQERALARRAARAEALELALAIDGMPVTFTGLRAEGAFALAAEHAGVTVVLTGAGLDPQGLALRCLFPDELGTRGA